MNEINEGLNAGMIKRKLIWTTPQINSSSFSNPFVLILTSSRTKNCIFCFKFIKKREMRSSIKNLPNYKNNKNKLEIKKPNKTSNCLSSNVRAKD